MMIDKTDTVVIGGGFAGLLTAIHLKELDRKRSVTVLEQGIYPPQNNALMILPPLTRQLLRRITPLNSYKFNEGRFLIFKIADIERDITIETIDTAVVNYLDFVQMFYQIALQMGVEIYENCQAVRIDKSRKLAEISSGKNIRYNHLIEAAGAGAAAKNESVMFTHSAVDRDIFCYPLQCAYTLKKADKNTMFKVVPTEDSLPKTFDETIQIGDMNGYIDHFIDIHTRYTVISAIYAAEAVYCGEGMKSYYRNMDSIADDIKHSLYVRQLVMDDLSLIHKPEFSSLITSILLYGNPYKTLYEYLKIKEK
jgi:flavin-dependent dehydrogenase